MTDVRFGYGKPDPPSPCLVFDAAGTLIATIDPLTRKRRNVNGRAEGTLSPQGWSLSTKTLIAWPGHGKPAPIIPIERTRYGKIKDRDSGRIGQGRGGGRPRKVRTT